MRVVVTGAAGVLGSEVALSLAALGHEVRGVDLRPLPERVTIQGSVQGMEANLTEPENCRRAVEGAEVVVHCASIHPWKDYPDALYWDLNVKATHHLLAAAIAEKAAKVVLTSSVEPFAGRPFAPEELPLPESIPPSPRRLYGLTKLVGEEIAERFHRVDGLCCVALRPATFIPYEEPLIGTRLLTGTWLYPADVVAAHVQAVTAPPPPSGWDACYIAPEVPYSAADVAATRRGQAEALAVFERHYPGTADLFHRHGLVPPTLNVFYSVDHAARSLAWRPQSSFADWLDLQKSAAPGQLRASYDRNRWLKA